MNNVGNSTKLFTALEYDERWVQAFILDEALAPVQTYKSDRIALIGHLIAPKLDVNGILEGDIAESQATYANEVKGFALGRDLWDLGAEDAEGFNRVTDTHWLEDELFAFSQGFGRPYQKGKAVSAFKLYCAEYESVHYLDTIDNTTPAGTELTSSDGRLKAAGVGHEVIGKIECHLAPHISTNATRIRVRFYN